MKTLPTRPFGWGTPRCSRPMAGSPVTSIVCLRSPRQRYNASPRIICNRSTGSWVFTCPTAQRRWIMTEAGKITHHSLPGPDDISRTVLPNGITLLVRTNQISPSVSFSGYLQAGSLYDPREKLGLSSLTAASLMRGTTSRSFQQIYDELESVGASLGFSSSTHTVGIGGRSLAEDLPMMLRLLAECLQQPVFPVEQVERLRAQAMTSFAIRAQDTAEMASLTFDEILFAGHPYALPEEGYKETVLAIQPADLQAFHHQHYGPRGMVLSIAGAVTAAQAFDLVSQALGDWTNSQQPPILELATVHPL
ncbi:insulinase family protein, partial [bacterium]|nr:insulinase family protein [bacterium]